MKISIQNISFSYNGTPTLDQIDFAIAVGELVALVGPNGSGKSTLIKCMNGLLKTQKGVVMIENKAIDRYAPSELAREMAYIPQNENRQSALNVFDVVLLGRKPYINWSPSEKDLSVTAEVIKKLHLEPIAMKSFSKLSGGQQQAVYMARALAQEPNVLLLDEPTSNLDIKHQVEVLELLKKLTQKGITVVIALHDINLASRYADKILMIKNGQLFAAGGRETITENNLEKLYDIKVEIIKTGEQLFVVPKGLN